jgi:hypothetical protein
MTAINLTVAERGEFLIGRVTVCCSRKTLYNGLCSIQDVYETEVNIDEEQGQACNKIVHNRTTAL